MALPADLTTYTLRFGPLMGFNAEDLKCAVSVTPTMSVVWNPTGETITAYPITKSFDSSSNVIFDLPNDADPNLVDTYGVRVTGRLRYLVEWRITNADGYVLETGTKYAQYVPGMANPYQVLLT